MGATLSAVERQVEVRAGAVLLSGVLAIPEEAQGIVLFAHGSGSSRDSPRNRQVAEALQEAALATLLFDLLSGEEQALDRFTAHLRFDLDLLAGRLLGATDWVLGETETRDLPVGYFGAGTGGGAALLAAAERPGPVQAVVSRGGRPDLAGEALQRVRAPTLLVVGGDDPQVLALNRTAMVRIKAPVKLEVIPGATHLFTEPGKLAAVARLAAVWLRQHLGAPLEAVTAA